MPRVRVHGWTEGKNPRLIEKDPLTRVNGKPYAPNGWHCSRALCDWNDPNATGLTRSGSCPKCGACEIVRNDSRPSKKAARASRHVVGVDLSVRATAACALPFPWDHDLSKVKMVRVGYSLTKEATPRERIERFTQIAHDVSVFCVNVRAHAIGLEEYAYSAGGSDTTQIAEAGGALKVACLELLDVAVFPVQASSARKVLLGKVPRLGRGKTKPWVIRNVKRLGGPTLTWTDDECDAFVVANLVLERAGAVAMHFAGE